MSYTFTATFGGDVILAPCLQALCAEIAASPKYKHLTNLGEIGDSRHKGQGTSSDHNPFVMHNGKGYIRAIDLGGDRKTLLDLRDELHALYVKKDRRVWPFGYFKGPDSLINDWYGPGWHVDTGDEGHLHISVTQRNGYHPSSGGYVAALDSRKPWGIGKPAAQPKPLKVGSPFPYRLKPHHYIGDVHGSKYSHGGVNAVERARVRFVFGRLKHYGYWHGEVPSVFAGAAMNAAVKRFKIRNGLPHNAKVGLGTWRKLASNTARAAAR